MPRDVVISAGADEPRTVVITDKLGQDLSACTFKVQLAPAGEKPTTAAWAAVTPTFSTGTGSTQPNVATIECRVSAGNAQPDHDYRICVQLTDGSAVYVLDAPEILHAI